MNNFKPVSIAKKSIKIFALWFLLNLILILFAWGKSYFVDFGEPIASYEIDLRQDKKQNPRKIIFIATQAEPDKNWFFGHFWVQFDKTPKGEPKNTYNFGYYAKDKSKAAKELAIATINPFGFYFGQKSVEGQIQIDDQWAHHLELVVLIDEAAMEKAYQTHYQWRRENKYLNRPAWGQKSYGCQDYAFAIANSIGLKTHNNHYGQFPAESFVKFAKLNGVEIMQKPSLGRYFTQ